MRRGASGSGQGRCACASPRTTRARRPRRRSPTARPRCCGSWFASQPAGPQREPCRSNENGDPMDLMELKEKNIVSREEAAAQLHAIADELASGNDIVMQRERLRFVARVPDEVELKLEFEVEDDGSEFEIELSW